MTVGGTEVSLAVGGSDVVVGTSTEPLAPYITAGFGTGLTANGTAAGAFAGSAGGRGRFGWREVGLVVLGMGVGVVVWL